MRIKFYRHSEGERIGKYVAYSKCHNHPSEKDDLCIGDYDRQGGITWEFKIVQYDFGRSPYSTRSGRALLIELFNESAQVLSVMKEFFQWFAKEKPEELDDVQAKLLSLKVQNGLYKDVQEFERKEKVKA